MNRDELRAAQAPLKEQYRNDPASALITLRASGALGDQVSRSVETGRALVSAGLHPATGGRLTAEGDLDFRGTLGVSKEAPVGFRDVRLSIDPDTDANDEEKAKLLELTQRYCVVYQTLRSSPSVSAAYG